MARNRKKIYKPGDRINIYLSRDITPEFVEWINKQSDLSNFFLYAAKQLYQQTGFIDVSEVMPRKINFELSEDKRHQFEKKTIEDNEELKQEEKEEPETEGIFKEDKKDKDPVWLNIEDLDDPFA